MLVIYRGGEFEEAEGCTELVVQKQTSTGHVGLKVNLLVEVMAEE